MAVTGWITPHPLALPKGEPRAQRRDAFFLDNFPPSVIIKSEKLTMEKERKPWTSTK
jgi:hypothetical protein